MREETTATRASADELHAQVEELQRVAAEQAALRRVATLVAGGARADELFDAVTREVGQLFDAETANTMRWDGATCTIVGAWCAPEASAVPKGRALELPPDTVTARVIAERGPARVDSPDAITSEIGRARWRELGFQASIGAPIVLDGRLWGLIATSRTRADDPFPRGAEHRLAEFAELLAHAIASAEARDALRASRARLVEAGDAERRRLERNLHDGAQQRLVSASIALAIAEGKVDQDPAAARELVASVREELAAALEELRELARGLHPAILSRGLEPALRALVERCPVPVALAADVPPELPATLAATAYYVVAEALTNVARHADAASASVSVSVLDAAVVIEVADDGAGGATVRDGSGLEGLRDRVDAIGGRLDVHSPAGGGTRLTLRLPLERGT
jgi:signal transduction histidine kinase